MAHLFPAHALAPAVRARIELMRARVGDGGMEVACGGASMAPAIRQGDRVRLRGGPARIGAVAAFVTATGELEMHRLVARGPLGWWAHLGDNQVDPEPGMVHGSQIVGIVDVPVKRPRVGDRARALVRFGRAAARLAGRRVGGAPRQPR